MRDQRIDVITTIGLSTHLRRHLSAWKWAWESIISQQQTKQETERRGCSMLRDARRTRKMAMAAPASALRVPLRRLRPSAPALPLRSESPRLSSNEGGREGGRRGGKSERRRKNPSHFSRFTYLPLHIGAYLRKYSWARAVK